jgi:hypothetical protein
VTPGRFFLYVVLTLFGYAGLVLLFAWVQSLIERGLEEPKEPEERP